MSDSAGPRATPRAIVLDPADNVSVALIDLGEGETVQSGPENVELREKIASGHKFALREIESGAPVIKYGEVIGVASSRISPGCHVHVHNVTSGRLPGPVQ